MSKKPTRSAVNSSASHVFDALRVVSEASEPMGVSEIARELSLPPSTVYRALITLEESEYIDRFQASSRYELGAMPRLLNRALLKRFALQREAGPALRQLADESGETASVSVRLGWYSLRIAVAYGSHDFYHRDRLGEVSPLHATLPSRTILAALSADDIARYWRFAERHFKPSAAERKAAEGAAAATQRDGFLAEIQQYSPGQSAVGMPLRSVGEVLAALTVHGPVARSGSGLAPASVTAARKALESIIAAAPERFASPFAHLDPDDIYLRLPPNPRGA
ncbi:IclR family transcriptional regulator [Terricaulis silvestris]|uniref:Acetate operon repressor n=1 Tax=Terricaulis silvestris TaxID=2686094 RepID=A0A6I6MQ72_9CAUL|nr:helix-turn-helix domain-containing protein [Terricaulis silvestris]QGZ93682.1 Acetate operon repressor [Terricaulis silvestris]